MKQLTEPVNEVLRFFGGNTFSIKVSDKLINKWQCENCNAIYDEDLEVCESCGSVRDECEKLIKEIRNG